MKLHPNLDNLREKIKEKYKSFNTFSFGFVNQFQNSKNKEILKRKNKNLIYNPNCFEQDQCKQIFEIIKNSFYQTIIKHVPEKPIFEEDDPTVNILKIFIFHYIRCLIIIKLLKSLLNQIIMPLMRFSLRNF